MFKKVFLKKPSVYCFLRLKHASKTALDNFAGLYAALTFISKSRSFFLMYPNMFSIGENLKNKCKNV